MLFGCFFCYIVFSYIIILGFVVDVSCCESVLVRTGDLYLWQMKYETESPHNLG
jgi:hypothetical protein